ncbi:MAG: glycosyltransferase family 9 protein [Oceanicaulis sp.]
MLRKRSRSMFGRATPFEQALSGDSLDSRKADPPNQLPAPALSENLDEAPPQDRDKPQAARTGLQSAIDAFRRGDYERGWRGYEWRYRQAPGDDLRAVTCARSGRKIPHWLDGEPPERLLVVAEQGLGDSIQFIRYAADLCDRGVDVTLADWPALTPLFSSAHPKLKFTSRHEAVSAESGEAFIRLLSLPLRLQCFEPLARGAYLRAPAASPEIAAELAELIDPRMVNVGLVWRGNPGHASDASRSMSLGALKPLFDLAGLNLINLQHDPNPVSSDPGLLSAMRRPSDRLFGANRQLDGVAALIRRLDMVISVDTALAHLAGALGTRTLLMLHRPDPDWRWPSEPETAAWYTSMTRVTQQYPGDWRGAVNAALPHLQRLIKVRRSSHDGSVRDL